MNGSLERRLKTVVADCGVSVLRIGEMAQGSFTACMNDDSFYDVSKAQVVWTSNNPSVASVGPDGSVKAVSMGVATITCAVTVDGTTVCDTFAVKVMPDLSLKSLKIDGKAVRLGSASQYSYLMKAGKAPKVEAVSADPAIAVAVRQAASVPGTAVITLSDVQTGDQKEVTVNFGVKGVSDGFDKAAPGKQWHWVREDASAWSLTEKPGSLVITGGKGDIAQGGATNLLLQSANSDWTAEVKMDFLTGPAAPAQNAGLVAYESDANFVKFVYGATFSFRRPADAGPAAGQLQLLVEENGQQKSLASLSMEGIVGESKVLYLRLVKKGDQFTAFYSVDGKKFEQMGTASAVLKDIQLGLVACEGAAPAMMRGFGGPRGGGMTLPEAAPLKVAFDSFVMTSTGLK
jgi:hypothetical protein